MQAHERRESVDGERWGDAGQMPGPVDWPENAQDMSRIDTT